MSNNVCQRCAGTGYEPDHAAIGARHRHVREGLKMSLREAAGKIGISAAYLSDLERGNRAWGRSISERVHEAYERVGITR